VDSIDEKLLQAWLLSLENFTDANEAKLNDLLPALIETGYVDEKPWGDDPDWFTKAGVRRSTELEAEHGGHE
jgi:hypothetical protein